jgi:hypothetical protein
LRYIYAKCGLFLYFVILPVPVRPYVLKFLHFHLGKCYFLSESDPFGLLLYHLLRRPVQDARRDHVLSKYKAKWEVDLGSYAGKKGIGDLTGKSVYDINKVAHRMLLSELHQFVEQAVDHGQQAKFAIEGFMLKLDLREEDIQFATLQKSWTRFIQDKKKSKKKSHSLTGRTALRDLKKGVLQVPLPAGMPAGNSSISAGNLSTQN